MPHLGVTSSWKFNWSSGCWQWHCNRGADALSLKRAKLACGLFLEEEESWRMNGWFSHLAEEKVHHQERTGTTEKGNSICPNSNDTSDVKFWMSRVVCFGTKPERILSVLLTRLFRWHTHFWNAQEKTFPHGVLVPPCGESLHGS